MKKLLISILLLIPVLCQSQTKNDIFNPDVPLVFFGADFTQVRFTKADEFTNKPDILRFFEDDNNLMKPKIFIGPLGKKLNRDEIKTDFTCVTRNNAEVDWQKVFSDEVDYLIPDDVIEEMIVRLNPDKQLYKDHVGMVFCQENYCKTKPLGSVAVVFFRINDLEPLLISHLSAKPGGFGFLNYWGVINGLIAHDIGKLEKELK